METAGEGGFLGADHPHPTLAPLRSTSANFSRQREKERPAPVSPAMAISAATIRFSAARFRSIAISQSMTFQGGRDYRAWHNGRGLKGKHLAVGRKRPAKAVQLL